MRTAGSIVAVMLVSTGCNQPPIRPTASLSDIPIRTHLEELDSGRFYVPVELDGVEREFHLDTGSTYTSVSFDEKTASYPVVGTKTRVSAAGRQKVEEKIRVGTLRLGPLAHAGFETVRYRKAANQESRIGMDGIAASRIHFDFAANRLRFGDPFPAIESFSLLAFPGGLFGVRGKLAGDEIEVLWDTGAELSTIDADVVRRHPEHFTFVQNIDQGTDATGAPVAFVLYEVRDLTLGGGTLSGKIMAMDFATLRAKLGAKVQCVLGFNLVRGHDWYFDFEHQRWAVRW